MTYSNALKAKGEPMNQKPSDPYTHAHETLKDDIFVAKVLLHKSKYGMKFNQSDRDVLSEILEQYIDILEVEL